MSLSDCPKCWDTPCTCGYEYEDWTIDALMKMRDMFTKLITEKQTKMINQNLFHALEDLYNMVEHETHPKQFENGVTAPDGTDEGVVLAGKTLLVSFHISITQTCL